MVTLKQLAQMEKMEINAIDPDTLADIREVRICGNTPVQRMESYFSQVKNPYCFRVGKTPVRISFQCGGKTLENKLKDYFIGIKIL